MTSRQSEELKLTPVAHLSFALEKRKQLAFYHI